MQTQEVEFTVDPSEMAYDKSHFVPEGFECVGVAFTGMVNTTETPVNVMQAINEEDGILRFIVGIPGQDTVLGFNLETCRLEADANLRVPDESVKLSFIATVKES